MRDRSIPTLDGWRALAVIWVCCYHGNTILFLPGGILPNRFIRGVSTQGELGVEMFFGLSGFLITTRLIRERKRSGEVSLGSFYLRRAFRILPAALAYLAVVAALAAEGLIPRLSHHEMTSALFFWRNYGPRGQATGHYWSLALEEHFYFLWPAAFCFISNERRLRKLAIGVALGIAVWRTIDTHFQIAHSIFPLIPAWEFRTDLRLDSILWGCIVALSMPSVEIAIARVGGLRAQICAAFAFIVFAGLRLFKVPFAAAGLAATIPLMIAATVAAPTVISRVLDRSPLRFIGRMSYSLYLWQQLFFFRPASVA